LQLNQTQITQTQNTTQVKNPQITQHNSKMQVENQLVINARVELIRPWDEARAVRVTVEDVAAAFRENPRLAEYASLPEHELTDPLIAPPYVTELMVDLVKRAHADPCARNIRLNPNRADQVLVQAGTHWQVRQMAGSHLNLLTGVASSIHAIIVTESLRSKLPLQVQNAMSMAGMLFEEQPEEYAKRASPALTAHLANLQEAAAAAGVAHPGVSWKKKIAAPPGY
jgi:hypothetical protein